VTDPWGNERIGFTANGELDREAFGLSWNQALETGGVVVGKQVQLEIEAEFVKA
jgi:polyisoprenoid-binding protein YceI